MSSARQNLALASPVDTSQSADVPRGWRMARRLWPFLVASAVSLSPFTVFGMYLVPIAAAAGGDVAEIGGLRGLCNHLGRPIGAPGAAGGAWDGKWWAGTGYCLFKPPVSRSGPRSADVGKPSRAPP